MTIGPWSLTLGEWATVVGLIGILLAAGKWMLEPRLKSLIKDAVAPDIGKVDAVTEAMTKVSDGLANLSEEMKRYRETTDKELQHHRERWAVYDALALRDRRGSG